MKISIYPLHDLDSDLKCPFEIDNSVSVIFNVINIENIDKRNVSKEDERHLRDTAFCLSVDEKIIRPEEASLLFMIACRLLKRTKLFIRYRIKSSNTVAKICDDYPFVTAHNATTQIKPNEFKKIAKLYTGLSAFSKLTKRSGNAVYFLSMAYRSRGWLESLIFHVCALETLTSSSTQEKGITEKFIKRVHSFIGYDEKKLRRIYDIRSELVHGRFSHKSAEENLKLNRIAEAASRKMFAKILLCQTHIDAFAIDEKRMKLFEDSKTS
jgi:hypothetical protein